MADELAGGVKSEPKLTVANAATDKALAPISPTGAAILPQLMLKIATVVVVLAGVAISLPSMGIALPPAAVAVATALVAIGSALGIASQGVRK